MIQSILTPFRLSRSHFIWSLLRRRKDYYLVATVCMFVLITVCGVDPQSLDSLIQIQILVWKYLYEVLFDPFPIISKKVTGCWILFMIAPKSVTQGLVFLMLPSCQNTDLYSTPKLSRYSFTWKSTHLWCFPITSLMSWIKILDSRCPIIGHLDNSWKVSFHLIRVFEIHSCPHPCTATHWPRHVCKINTAKKLSGQMESKIDSSKCIL